MVTSTTQTVDIAQALAAILETVPGVRSYWAPLDTVRPPTAGGAAVIGQPDIDFADSSSGFCNATWTFGVTLVTSRNDPASAMRVMSQLLLDVVAALDVDVPGIFSIEPLDARPIPVLVNGVELPGYTLSIRIRA
jgi:hypothetical protein